MFLCLMYSKIIQESVFFNVFVCVLRSFWLGLRHISRLWGRCCYTSVSCHRLRSDRLSITSQGSALAVYVWDSVMAVRKVPKYSKRRSYFVMELFSITLSINLMYKRNWTWYLIMTFAISWYTFLFTKLSKTFSTSQFSWGQTC